MLKRPSIPFKVLLLSLAHTVTDLSQGALLVALPYFKAKFALGYAEVSAIVLVQNLTSSVIQPLFGYLSDRSSRAWMMPAGCCFAGMAMLAALWAPSYPLLLVCTVLNGLCIAAFHPEAAKAAHRFSGASKGKGVSLFVVGGNAGFAIGSAFMAILLASGAGEKLLLFILPNLVMAYPLSKLARKVSGETVAVAAPDGRMKLEWSLPLIALLAVVFIRATISSGVSTFIPLYYVSYLHGNELYAGKILTVCLASGAIGTLFGGTLSDRYGSKRVMIWSILPVTLMLSVFQIMDGLWVFLPLGITSALLSASFSSSVVLIQRMMPNNVGMASGLAIGFSVGLGGMGVLGLGKLADIWSLPLVFDILAVLPLAGFIFTLFVKESKNPAVGVVSKQA